MARRLSGAWRFWAALAVVAIGFVIYRELFPSGLTLIDKGHLGQLATAHVIARQELRELVTGLALPEVAVEHASR